MAVTILMALDLKAIAERSYERINRRIPADAPGRTPDGDLGCPFCGGPLTVRFSKLGWLEDTPDGTRPRIEQVGFKHADDGAILGCGLRWDFDVPLRAGSGYWPGLDGADEFERELAARDDKRSIDFAYDADADPTASVEARLEQLGYIQQ